MTEPISQGENKEQTKKTTWYPLALATENVTAAEQAARTSSAGGIRTNAPAREEMVASRNEQAGSSGFIDSQLSQGVEFCA